MTKPDLTKILAECRPTQIAAAVTNIHDDIRLAYAVGSLRVRTFADFEAALRDYYWYHYTKTVAPGARIEEYEAIEQAKGIVAHAYDKDGLTIGNAFEDAMSGTNGGLRHIFDLICDALKAGSKRRYMEHVVDRHVPPNDWTAKVELVRQVMEHFAPILPVGFAREGRAEQYANDYKQLIYVCLDTQSRLELQALRT